MENSKIEWTHHTFNPWMGCTKVSDGCKHCYAESLMDHRYGKVQWGPQGTRNRTSSANWKKPHTWNRKAQRDGTRYRVFCASLADVFEDRPELDEYRRDLFHMIQETPKLDWLLLTKRPELINETIERCTYASDKETWFYANQNVWIGTSVEDQAAADRRIPHLLNVPATIRFLSMEPLLGPVDLGFCYGPQPDWVIVGGESGPEARPMQREWVRSILEQCETASIPFFFKQWGEHDQNGDRVGKKNAGNLLDGKVYQEFPDQQPLGIVQQMGMFFEVSA